MSVYRGCLALPSWGRSLVDGPFVFHVRIHFLEDGRNQISNQELANKSRVVTEKGVSGKARLRGDFSQRKEKILFNWSMLRSDGNCTYSLKKLFPGAPPGTETVLTRGGSSIGAFYSYYSP